MSSIKWWKIYLNFILILAKPNEWI
jgi:hypothetical protein